MATQLHVIPARLHNLSSKLKQDRDIKGHINQIAMKAQAAEKAFKSVILYEGNAVLLQKTLLLTSPQNKISLSDMQCALNAATAAMAETRKLVVCLQSEMHSVIETCRGRKSEYESKLDNILSQISDKWAEMEKIELTIPQLEDEASVLNMQAIEMKNKADRAQKKARKKRKNVETTEMVGGLIGLALAPFTGGTSLSLSTAATGISAAANLPQACEYDKLFYNLRNDAGMKTERADKLKTEKTDLMDQRSKLQREVAAVMPKAEGITEAANVLRQVTTFLLPTINVIDQLLHAFQEMDSAIKEVLLQNDSFVIIQEMFGNKSERTGKYPTKYLDKVKDKWNKLERILIQYGAQN